VSRRAARRSGRRRPRRVGRRVLRYGLKALAFAAATNPEAVARRFEFDPDWRRVDEVGGAARLGVRQTYRPTHVTGRWQSVDPRLPYDGWRSGAKASGLGLWALVVTVLGWLGWWKGWGPLRGLAEYRQPEPSWDDLGGPAGELPFEVPRADGAYW
jgi:hypothetical protein